MEIATKFMTFFLSTLYCLLKYLELFLGAFLIQTLHKLCNVFAFVPVRYLDIIDNIWPGIILIES